MRRALLVLMFAAACKGGPEPPPNPGVGSGDTTPTGEGTTTTGSDRETDSWTDGIDTVSLAVDRADSLSRSYALSSTHPQRDGWPQDVHFEELGDQPVLRSGSLIFDALFALAVHESRLLSVSAIADSAFDNGNPVACDCFQTGDLWRYVWTRDTAYAADLGMAWIDPVRARASLDFKLAADKPSVGAGGLQVVQDTGTGGSWPVSTDRVVWALGARRVLATLPLSERAAFRDRALEALVNTAEADRVQVYDASDGLYRGETSFLDWREQTYPQWTASDVRHIAESKSLSTNAGHHALLELAADLSAEAGDPAGEARYRAWAQQLAADIEARFWIEGSGYARVLPNQLDPGPLEQRDWLGTSLVALGIADPAHADVALASYPLGEHGPPVIWPQQPSVPIYHNRAIWPFVTAYGVRAGARHGHDGVVANGVHSLTRGALLNLSNMENLEVASGRNWVDDGPYSGPVLNSHFQLWSVAGYLSMVFDLVGLRPELDGLYVEPFIPAEVADEWMEGAELSLHRMRWQGRQFDMVLELPPSGSGPLVAASMTVDGSPVSSPLGSADLGEGATLRVVLEHAGATGATTTALDPSAMFAPEDPIVPALTDVGGSLQLALDANGATGVSFDVWRDGVQVATGVSGPTWTDPNSGGLAATSYCYAVASRFAASGIASQRSAPVCWWGAAGERVTFLDAYALAAEGAAWRAGADPHWADWGGADRALVHGVRPDWSGPHLLQVVASNGAGPTATGVTAANLQLVVRDPSGAVVAEGPAVVAQSGSWGAFGDSTGLVADLTAGTSYQIELRHGRNMSWLQHFSTYTGGQGGGPDPYSFADLRGVKLLPLAGTDQTPSTGQLAVFDGVDDYGKFAGTAQIAPGATLQPWEGVAIDWDADHLYIAWVSQAFEGDYPPWVLYIEASRGPLGPAVPGTGFDYSGLVPDLPFTPTHAVSLRGLSDDGSPAGPWDGVRVNDGSWTVTRRFARDRDSWLAGDRHTLAVRIPRSLLGDPTHLRLAGHVVNAVVGSEWADVVPAGHTPWAAGGGAHYDVDLSAAPPW